MGRAFEVVFYPWVQDLLDKLGVAYLLLALYLVPIPPLHGAQA